MVPKKDETKRRAKVKKLGLAKFIHTKPKSKMKVKSQDPGGQGMSSTKVVNIKDNKKNLSLVDRCKLQMSSSMLRLVDEALYTSETKDISLDKDKFLAYHEAYASVCERWPVKPIDYIVRFIKKRILPKKSIQKLKFADIGCGIQPLLKQKLPTKAKVLSFDLVSMHDDVIQANMEKLPLDNESVHCSVYSLSLMAKNLGAVILEGKRVLKICGSMLIVEVTSRFQAQERRFIGRLEKLGLKHRSTKTLEPNGYFTFFHFTKSDATLDYPSSALKIQLKPCAYKAR